MVDHATWPSRRCGEQQMGPQPSTCLASELCRTLDDGPNLQDVEGVLWKSGKRSLTGGKANSIRLPGFFTPLSLPSLF